eukprot:5850552-Pyramimonas_sp.AAC.1
MIIRPSWSVHGPCSGPRGPVRCRLGGRGALRADLGRLGPKIVKMRAIRPGAGTETERALQQLDRNYAHHRSYWEPWTGRMSWAGSL